MDSAAARSPVAGKTGSGQGPASEPVSCSGPGSSEKSGCWCWSPRGWVPPLVLPGWDSAQQVTALWAGRAPAAPLVGAVSSRACAWCPCPHSPGVGSWAAGPQVVTAGVRSGSVFLGFQEVVIMSPVKTCIPPFLLGGGTPRWDARSTGPPSSTANSRLSGAFRVSCTTVTATSFIYLKHNVVASREAGEGAGEEQRHQGGGSTVDRLPPEAPPSRSTPQPGGAPVSVTGN